MEDGGDLFVTFLIGKTTEGHSKRLDPLLCIVSGILIGVAFPPSPFSTVAYVGFIPFLFLLERTDNLGAMLRFSYLTMLVVHAVTLYWVGGFTHMHDTYLMLSGAGVLFIHPFFYWIPLAGSWFIKRRWGIVPWLTTFPVLWVSFEYVHSLGEFSFPWLTMGNSQAYDIYRIQIAEWTSVYGLSLIILIFNVLGYVLVRNLALHTWRFASKPSAMFVAALILLHTLPMVYGAVRLREYEGLAGNTALRIGIIQPNVDPFEKWWNGSYVTQLQYYFKEIEKLSVDSLDLVLLPETAIPFRIMLPENANYYNLFKHEVDLANTPVFTGLADAETMDSASASVTAQWSTVAHAFVESYNAATLFVPYERNGPVYRKMRLVPYAERVPYAETFSFLVKPLKWGVGLSSWGKGEEQWVYPLKTRSGDTVRFSGMICYELIYPDFVREFVRKGAEFLVVVSNDSWWGNTSGAYQLAAFTSIRAVENRRWIVRCANGGLSACIDPAGRVYSKTSLYEAITVIGTIKTMDEQTFYVRHGNIVGPGCLMASVLLVLGAAVKRREH